MFSVAIWGFVIITYFSSIHRLQRLLRFEYALAFARIFQDRREEKETYVGLTATEFKTRWRNHQMSFKHKKKRYDTELSKYLWELKTKNEERIEWWKLPVLWSSCLKDFLITADGTDIADCAQIFRFD